MHKKLEADLISLAHSILQMKNKEDVFALKAKAHQLYEKLALLAYVEEYIDTTPNATTTKEALFTKIAAIENNIADKEVITTTNPIVSDTNFETEDTSIENDVTTTSSTNTIAEEPPIHEEEFLVENKDREEIPFTIKQALEQPLIQESLFEEPEKEARIENEIIEQPFDALENILFGDTTDIDTISSIDTKDIEDVAFVEEKQNLELQNILSNDKKDIEDVAFIEETNNELEQETQVEEEKISIDKITTQPIVEETPPLKEETTKKLTLEEELADTLSVDVMANLFEKAPVKKTVNDLMFRDTITIDLNDRIAFVKNLFEGNQEDFNRVISQLNTMKSEKEGKHFILKMIKPDYDWSSKEVYEARLLEIIERRFN